ncbi:MAG: histidine--tRNA ligase [Alistipes sp.]|jgi:histidyl-tRNA synthetase|nr:histidine--tRNA ligase [Alistipes sp.]
MAVQKPSIPKGTRDFSQAETARRNYIFDTCRDVFRLYGYAPIETPAMENLSTLLGKYGEEGDKLLFRIQNSGEQASAPPEKGLRYDLTVPFARYVVQHQSDIAFPFKRYQMQSVWRADRPQKGRYREFYQCDVDVIGSKSLVNELELIQIVESVFGRLGVGVVLKLNNRKILAGIAETIGAADRLVDITVAIDKLEKIGLEAVKAELAEKGLAPETIARLEPILSLSGSSGEKLRKLGEILAGSDTGLPGLEEMGYIFAMIEKMEIQLDVELDLSLARGLNYYTGTIFEVKARDWPIGSICGGGRYDDLTGIFGMPGVSGVGISFGADRIYDVMEGLGLFPGEATGGAKVLFLNFGGPQELASLRLLARLRGHGIAAEIYPDAAKMKKQMEWANRRNIPHVVIIGEDELARGEATLKDMRSGEQRAVAFDRLGEIFV